MSRNPLLAKVHIAKKRLGLDDETYRAVLQRVTGRTSSKDLSEHQLLLALAEFRRLGWEEPAAAKARKSGKPHVRKVWVMWRELCDAGIPREPTRAALRSFVERMTKVTDPEWLSPEQAIVVIEALKAWRARGKKEATP